ncbi:hypothetical protein DICVIV_09363 [Dictyocaulus viviparus]|uniref:Uncharacterized protein n=1 Tax=Dictyocaulus viviparus TaxID=29172 RepID=A0A0D8XQG3_DICVI|nr:hypothetical protein DICVIV_09363 [Dictyocaulus viviparus]
MNALFYAWEGGLWLFFVAQEIGENAFRSTEPVQKFSCSIKNRLSERISSDRIHRKGQFRKKLDVVLSTVKRRSESS